MVSIFREAEDIHSRESSNTYINSLGSYFIDFNLLVDLSNTSIGSLDSSYSSDASMNFIEPVLVRFLTNAYDLHDVKALRTGTQLLLEIVNNCTLGHKPMPYVGISGGHQPHLCFPRGAVFKSWATCVYYKDMGKRWYIFVECVPVILSYEREFPFQNVFSYSQISIKWPYTQIDSESCLQCVEHIPQQIHFACTMDLSIYCKQKLG
ncbi:hypothetical protein glysoja_045307 [Glycine soja]|uniref:Uncharacterized protein n=1 Tax=Glycine soja TaxID=3848 RepID=A0A0B2R9V0_GLYSO|nr:hypothetical protein glysoja_045307 [Glycine soja]